MPKSIINFIKPVRSFHVCYIIISTYYLYYTYMLCVDATFLLLLSTFPFDYARWHAFLIINNTKNHHHTHARTRGCRARCIACIPHRIYYARTRAHRTDRANAFRARARLIRACALATHDDMMRGVRARCCGAYSVGGTLTHILSQNADKAY